MTQSHDDGARKIERRASNRNFLNALNIKKDRTLREKSRKWCFDFIEETAIDIKNSGLYSQSNPMASPQEAEHAQGNTDFGQKCKSKKHHAKALAPDSLAPQVQSSRPKRAHSTSPLKLRQLESQPKQVYNKIKKRNQTQFPAQSRRKLGVNQYQKL